MPKARKYKPRSCEINLIYQNVRGLRSKTHTFNNNVLQNAYDIIALTETFLNNSVSDGELFPQGYHVVRKDRAGDVGWGGVLLAVRDCFNVRVVEDNAVVNVDKELLSAIVSSKQVKFLCCVVYLPPNYKDDQYLNVLSCLEDLVCSYSDMKVLIIGDFNLNSVTANVKTHFDYFCEFCSLHQHSGVVNNHGGMLDLVLSNFEPDQLAVSLGVDPLVRIDKYHPALDIVIKLSSSKISDGASMCQQPSPRSGANPN